MIAHLGFDLLAYLTTALLVWLTVRHLGSASRNLPEGYGTIYFTAASMGVITGSVLLGSANLWLAGVEAFLAKSVLGGLVGGVIAVELLKRRFRLQGSTGAVLVIGLCFGIAIGRVGCFYGGLEDQTYGIATSGRTLFGFHLDRLGVDFGDNQLRYPVQLFESASLALLGLVNVALLLLRPHWLMRHGFYLFCAFYAAQRFFWEFLKPYPTFVSGLNLFQLTCIGLLCYAFAMTLQPNTNMADRASTYG